jgi:glutathione S-transferase
VLGCPCVREQDHVYSKGTVPAVVDGGRVLGESALVAEYLDEK